MNTLGIVVIGRNEGERLVRCLQSLRGRALHVVYVDSGSTDGSVAAARSLGAEVVALDMSTPFTAARARNAGRERMRALQPHLEYVQFVDGDCEVIEGWLDAAVGHLASNPHTACVCGRLSERHPEHSVYNRLCDAEWDRPAGDTDACGGIAMMRLAMFDEVDGFRSDMAAGEEPELCARLRARGWRIHRLAQPMAWHDAAMLRFSQWWKRSRRTGYSYALRLAAAGDGGDDSLRRQLRSAWLWAGVLPLAIVAALATSVAVATLLLAAYPVQVARLSLRNAEKPWRRRIERALFLVLGKFPELLGVLEFRLGQRAGSAGTRFDYKS